MTDWWNKPRPISVCVDSESWFDPFARELVDRANGGGDSAVFVRNPPEVQSGGIAFFLSCLKLTPEEILARNHRNIVVHASALPQGRGFSPLAWQILEGRDSIAVTMIEAALEADSGDILLQDRVDLRGHELNDEMRAILGRKIVNMCLHYLNCPEPPRGRPQVGEPSWYRRRRPDDSRLDPERTIAEQFPLLRVVDNERYPAFFDYRGHRYIVRIERATDDDVEEANDQDG